MTQLRQKMLEELQRRNYSPHTIRYYLSTVADFARHFKKSPDKPGPDHLRSYHAYLLTDRKLAVQSVVARVAALRFFFIRTLKRPELREDLPYPKRLKKYPVILSPEEITRRINAARSLTHRTLLMVLYGTGLRREEVSLLKVANIDSSRMTIHKSWIRPRYRYLVPVKVLSKVFRGKFLHRLKWFYRKKKLRLAGAASCLQNEKCFAGLIRRLYKKSWMVYAKPAFGGPMQVIRYLGRYTHRVAISNHRITNFDGEKATFSGKIMPTTASRGR